MNFEDIVRQARRDVFNTVKREWRCYTGTPHEPTSVVEGEYRERIIFGGSIGTDSVFDTDEIKPRIDFLANAHTPAQGNVYVLLIDGEPEWVNTFQVLTVASDGLKHSASCTEVCGDQLYRYQYPEGEGGGGGGV